MSDMIDDDQAVAKTGVPQRGAEPRIPPREPPERRSDVLSVRIKPSVRATLMQMSERTRIPVAELAEIAIELLRKEGY